MAEHRYTLPAPIATAQTDRWFGPREGLPEVDVVDREGRIAFEEVKEMFPEDVLGLARFARR